jgi:hypothetical protein
MIKNIKINFQYLVVHFCSSDSNDQSNPKQTFSNLLFNSISKLAKVSKDVKDNHDLVLKIF